MAWTWEQKDEMCNLILPQWVKMSLAAGFTTRKGGHSCGECESLNLGLHVGDRPQAVIANREKVACSFEIDLGRMVCAEQVHGNRVAVVGRGDMGRGTTDYGDSLAGFDGMITDQPGIFLTAFFADCIPIFLFDPQKRSVGLVHSGWKGTVLRIADVAINAMKKNYDSRPEDIRAFIGPGIGPECFEINEERLSQVKKAFAWADKIVYPDEEDRYRWDLHLTNELIIGEAGVPKENIASCGICTACNQDVFFSYRGAGGRTGRMAAVLGLRD